MSEPTDTQQGECTAAREPEQEAPLWTACSGRGLYRLRQVGEPALPDRLCPVPGKELRGIGEVQIDVFQVTAHPLEAHLQLCLHARNIS